MLVVFLPRLGISEKNVAKFATTEMQKVHNAKMRTHADVPWNEIW